MNVLLLGSGGREHALAWKIAQSPLVSRLFCAPGNAGIAQVCEVVSLNPSDHHRLVEFCKNERVEFVVVGPEVYLVEGVVDALNAANIAAFGPSALAAQLEGSKGFTKDLCKEFNIPTAAYERFTDAASAKSYITAQGAPIVVKADGLAAGKGVVVAMTLDEAFAAIDMMFVGGEGEVVVEEFMEGEEVSFFALSDGERVIMLGSAQDHKRVGDGDIGPNTGGMGAYSPAPAMTPDLVTRTMAEIIEPTVAAMKARGTRFRGVLFAGLMLTKDGPKLIEYNCRFGDPECQVLMPRLDEDIVPWLMVSAMGKLPDRPIALKNEAALTVVMAAKGYPVAPVKGGAIDLAAVNATDAMVFHAGTLTKDGRLIANGGRVLNVTAMGSNVKEAQRKAYSGVDAIDFEDGFCRRDIGWRAVEREA